MKIFGGRKKRLDMLGPGQAMLAAGAVCLALAGVCALLKWREAAVLLAVLGGSVIALMLILVRIELFLDARDNRRYQAENKRNGVL